MMMEEAERRVTVREGYQILLRAEAHLLLPVEGERMRWFYEQLAATCMTWAEEIHGERLRREFLALDSLKDKSQFRTQYYRLAMRVAWEDAWGIALLCESELTGQWKNPQKSFHRISHVWSLAEQLLLPPSQILAHFGVGPEKKQLPFRPDGIYPEGGELVFFRNASERERFREERIPLSLDGAK